MYKNLRVILTIFLLIACSPHGKQTGNQSSIIQHLTVSNLAKLPEETRICLIIKNYRSNIVQMNKQRSEVQFDKLKMVATKLKDKILECLILQLRADYYYTKKGENPYTPQFYEQAINFAERNNLLIEKGVLLYRKGTYYKLLNLNVPTAHYFLKAIDVFNEIGYAKIPHIADYLIDVGSFFCSIEDHETAKIYLSEAIKYKIADYRSKINLFTELGIIHYKCRQFKPAMKQFSAALNLAVLNRDTAWIGISKGNIGSIYFFLKRYPMALDLLNVDYCLSLKHNNRLSAASALIKIIEIRLKKEQLNIAVKQLHTVHQLIKDQPSYFLDIWIHYYELSALVAEKEGKISRAIKFRKAYESVKDSLIKQKNIVAVERIKLKMEIERHKIKIHKMKADKKLVIFKFEVIISLLSVFLIFIPLIYLKQKRENQFMKSQKRVMDEELRAASLELKLFTELQRNNINLTNSDKGDIKSTKAKSNSKPHIDHQEKPIMDHIMTDEKWGNFKKELCKIHPCFLKQLKKNHPNLTFNDIRILSLAKLQLTNNEMAVMLGVTIDGIKKAKQRLKKRMNLGINETIEMILENI